jgi:hypothetical protein
MAGKAHLPGRAENAAHGAADLRADAGRVAIAVGHEHRFDPLPVLQAQEEFARTVGAPLFQDQLGPDRDGFRREFRAQPGPQLAHPRDANGALPVEIVPQLLGVVRAVAPLLEERRQGWAIEIEQIAGCCRRRHKKTPARAGEMSLGFG